MRTVMMMAPTLALVAVQSQAQPWLLPADPRFERVEQLRKVAG